MKDSNKESKDFATIMAQILNEHKDKANGIPKPHRDTTTEKLLQQPIGDRGYGGTIPSLSESHRGGNGRSTTLVAPRLGIISLPTQGHPETNDSQGRDEEISRSAGRDTRDSERDTRDSERECNTRQRDTRDSEAECNTKQRDTRDSEAEQRARQLDYINRELQDRNRAVQSRVRQFLQLCNVKTKFTNLENQEFSQHANEQALLKAKLQKALKAYEEAGAIIPSQKPSKHKGR